MRRTISAIALVMAMTTSAAGAGTEEPASFAATRLWPQSQVDLRIMPYFDVDALLAEDESGSVERSRHPMRTDFTPNNSGTWESLPEGGAVWRLRLESTGAHFLVLGFDRIQLPEGAVLHMYDAARAMVLGPFTGEDVPASGKLWSTSIDGDVAVVELFWPEFLAGETPDLRLGTVSHVYRPIEPARGVEECSPDVNCPLGLGIDVVQRGAVRVYIGEAGIICSGSLINNVRNDGTPYVLTAEHCVEAALDANPGDDLSSSEILFNYERPSCGPPPDVPPDDDRLSGLTLRAMWAPADMALLELDQSIPSSFCARLNGWSRSTVEPLECGTVHQPAGGAPKKVSVRFDPPTMVDNYWRIDEWDIGNTRSGSSGAPLFDKAGRIIGQLCCGELEGVDPPECRQDLNDKFGRVDLSWNGGGSQATRLRDWLDPDGTGVISHHGMEAAANGACGDIGTHVVGNVRASVTDRGIFGFMDETQSDGSGFVYPYTGANQLYVGGLWVGDGPDYVANRDYDRDPEKEWVVSVDPDGHIVIDHDGTSEMDVHASYTDDGGPASRGLFVRQESWSFASEDRDDGIILRYFIENKGATTLRGLYAGLFADLDLGGSPLNEGGGVYGNRLLAYMYDQGVHVGICLLGGSPEPDVPANVTLVRNSIHVWPDSYVRDEDKFGLLSAAGPEYVLTESDGVDDYSVLVSAGPMDLAPRQINEVAFAVVGGESLEALLANAESLQQAYSIAIGSDPADVSEEPNAGASVQLADIAPNPLSASASAAIRYDVAQREPVDLAVYSVAGRRVRTLAQGIHDAGPHLAVWDGRNDRGQEVGSGIYFVRVTSGTQTSSRQVTLVK